MAILLIVYGHIIPGFIPSFAKYVSTFHIPLFFFVSGILFNGKKYESQFKLFFKTRIQVLVAPFIYLSLIVMCGYYYLEKDYVNFIKQLISNGWGGYALWFIPVLFMVELVYYPFCNTKKYLICMCLFVSILLSYVSSITYGYIPHNALLVFCGLFFYGMGNLCRPILEYVYNFKIQQLGIAFVLGLLISLSYYPITPSLPEWFINKIPCCIYYITPLGAITSMVVISILIEKWANKCMISLLSICGKQSLIILAFHQIICMLLQQYLSSKFAILFMIIILTVLVVHIPRRAPWLLGKTKQ